MILVGAGALMITKYMLNQKISYDLTIVRPLFDFNIIDDFT